MRFSIYEGYIEALNKKVTRIRNKCAKYGCDFHYEEVGEEFRTVKNLNGEDVVARFVIVEAEGTAIVNGWEMVASVEHTENGNIFSKALTDVEIPEKYRTTQPICEHCNVNRHRKHLFIVRNTETGEFRQVGKSCLMDYTNGMSAEFAAFMASCREVFERAVVYVPEGGSYEEYYDTESVLRYGAEVVRHFGYVSSSEIYATSTKERTMLYYLVDTGRITHPVLVSEARKDMRSVGFDSDSEQSVKLAKDALEWIKTQEASSDYMHNLKVVTSLPYTNSKRAGILVSLLPVYKKELARQAAIKRKEEQLKRERKSEWVGEVGKRIDIDVESVISICSWSNSFDGYNVNTTFLYKIIDVNGNVFIWKTQKVLDNVNAIKGTVKEHSDYKGIKQTVLTRCKVA